MNGHTQRCALVKEEGPCNCADHEEHWEGAPLVLFLKYKGRIIGATVMKRPDVTWNDRHRALVNAYDNHEPTRTDYLKLNKAIAHDRDLPVLYGWEVINQGELRALDRYKA